MFLKYTRKKKVGGGRSHICTALLNSSKSKTQQRQHSWAWKFPVTPTSAMAFMFQFNHTAKPCSCPHAYRADTVQPPQACAASLSMFLKQHLWDYFCILGIGL